MSLRAVLGLGTSLVVLLVACGGNVTGVGSSGGSSGSSGSSSGSSGGSSGSSGSSGGSCTTETLPGDRACVPGTAAANVPIQIGVDATDGCLGCFTSFDPCKVDVNGSHITVAMVTRTCPPVGDGACPAVCMIPKTTCTIPALAAGTYTIEVSGEDPGKAQRQLVVTAGGTKSSCTLPNAGVVPAPLDGSAYAKSCSHDEDCVVVTSGDVCKPCVCPNLAIAKSASEAYGSDYRERSSQCAASKGNALCAACAPTKPGCEISPNALTGVCVVKPGL